MKRSTGILFLCMSFLAANSLFAKEVQNYGTYQTIAKSNSGLAYSELRGHVPPIVKTSKKLGSVENDKGLTLSVALNLNAQDDLEQFLHDVYDPKSATYRKFLSTEDYNAKYSPTDQQVQQVTDFLKSQGFQIKSTDSNRLLIHVAGTVANINQAFATQIDYYTDPEGRSYFAPTFELQIPQGLPIQAVHGLENWTQPHYNHVVRNAVAASSGTFMTPSAIQKAYQFPTQLTGAGQVLGLVALDGYNASDIVAYETKYGLPNVPLQNVLIDGFSGQPTDPNYTAEVTLDIEMMIAVAPGVSKIMVYEAPAPGSSATSMVDVYNKIATDNIAKSISSSYSIPEALNVPATAQTENTIFQQMAAQGQTFFAASGDNGAYFTYNVNGTFQTNLTVNDPASQPYVTAVGGTALSTNTDGSYLSETTWTIPNASGGIFLGSNGGVSSVWDIPSWQQGIVSAASKGSTTMRNVPDVSLNASSLSSYPFYVGGNWAYAGGTSCAAPIWAAYIALVNQQRASNNLGPIGFLNSILSQIGQSNNYNSVFHDIQDGSTNGYYPAVTGFDNATGWGSMQGTGLLQVLASGPLPIPTSPIFVWWNVETPSPSGTNFASLLISNTSSTQDLSNWQLSFTFANSITNAYYLVVNGATINVSSNGNTWILDPPSSNTDIPPLNSAYMGVHFNGDPTILPTDCVLNGVPCTFTYSTYANPSSTSAISSSR